MANYGYIRVSSKEQNEDRQVIAMTAEGLKPEELYIDKESGKDFDRTMYQKMLRKLKEGDVVYVQSIDRFGRNYEAIIEEWNRITKKKKACIKVLDMPLLDTSRDRDLTGKLIADIVLQLFSYVAQTEREHIKERQRQGIEAARKRGVHLGRTARPLPDNFNECVKLWKSGEITQSEAAIMCGMPNASFRYRLKDYKGGV